MAVPALQSDVKTIAYMGNLIELPDSAEGLWRDLQVASDGSGEASDGLPTESRRYGRLENLRYECGKPAAARGFLELADGRPGLTIRRQDRCIYGKPD